MHSGFVQHVIHSAIWSSQYIAWTLLACVAVIVCFYWSFRIPSPGKAVAAMGIVAAITALRGEMSNPEKFFWLALLFIFLLIEVRAIDRDRKKHDDEQSVIRNEETQKFQHIADGLTAAISGINETVQRVTGGDTFCYLDIFGEQIPLTNASLRKHGTNPLYDVTMKLLVMTPIPGGSPGQSRGEGTIKLNIGNMTAAERPAFGDISLAPFNLNGKESVDFYVAFAAKNGFWHQKVYFRRIGGLVNGGRWLKAIRIHRIDYGSEPYKQAKPVLILERIDENFPMEGIAWNDLLLYDH
jgi:hypothetical protein